MDRLKIFSNETEARFAHDLLTARGVHAEVIGAKDYTSHVLGGGQGRYELLVDASQLQEAQKILAALPGGRVESVEAVPSAPPNFFKRSVFFALTGIIVFPLLFNGVSLWNAKRYWQTSPRDVSARGRVFLLLALQLPGLLCALWILRSLAG